MVSSSRYAAKSEPVCHSHDQEWVKPIALSDFIQDRKNEIAELVGGNHILSTQLFVLKTTTQSPFIRGLQKNLVLFKKSSNLSYQTRELLAQPARWATAPCRIHSPGGAHRGRKGKTLTQNYSWIPRRSFFASDISSSLTTCARPG